jgi:DNA mismatch repair ATPase MutS
LGVYLLELIKSFFLIEVIALFRITKELKHKKRDIQNLFDYIGKIDSALSVASLRAGATQTCIPEFSTGVKAMQVKGMYHPLIENCVENELTIENKSILITGSNMSGKSTFLRTLIINSIVAQTIYTCFASQFKSPILKQFSSIRIADDLFEGKSYYFQEVSIMASLLNHVNSSDQNIFVLDEVFKGTNTIERIAAAKAILSFLNQGNHIVLVATHDHELSELLSEEYDLYHFTEQVKDGELYFDHRIKIGPLKMRNAIKVLELSNYPEDVIREARLIALKLAKAQKLAD